MTRSLSLAAVAWASAFSIALELLQTRIFGFMLWNHFVYLVVTTGLMGLAVGGAALARSEFLRGWEESRLFGAALAVLPVAAVASTRFAAWPLRLWLEAVPGPVLALRLGTACVLSMSAFVPCGVILAAAFERPSGDARGLYVSSMAGSAAGSALFAALLPLVGAGWFLWLCCLPSLWLAAVLLGKSGRRGLAAALAAIAAACLLPACLADFSPEAHKDIRTIFPAGTVVEKTLWNAISRIDVVSDAAEPSLKVVVLDGGAESKLFPPGTAALAANQEGREIGYDLAGGSPGEVLVIGVGGGRDVAAALARGARHVDAVEIDPSVVRVVRDLYAAHLAGLFSDPRVSLYAEDGRGFVARSDRRYRFINLFSADSLAALCLGSYVTTSDFLYTREAFAAYLERLAPDGMLQLVRWYVPPLPAQALRLFATALQALRDRGYAAPGSHVAIIEKDAVATVIVKRSAFAVGEKQQLARLCARKRCSILYPPELAADRRTAEPFARLALDFAQGRPERFYESYPANVAPVGDDRPFFFDYSRVGPVRSLLHGMTLAPRAGTGYAPALMELLLIVILLSAAIVAASPARRALSLKGLYFAFAGSGFMMAEMGLMQRLGLWLGHPVYAMAVILPAIFGLAGLGALSARRLSAAGAGPAAAALLAALGTALSLLVMRFSQPWVMPLPLPLRVACAVAATAPCALGMGLPFPAALESLVADRRDASLAWTLSSAACVVASVAALMSAMAAGFSPTTGIGASCYLAAAGLAALA